MGSQLTVPKTVTLSGKVSIVTGANTGIGYETAKDLASRGSTVIIACRNKDAGQQAVSNIKKEIVQADSSKKEADVKVEFIRLDLASLRSVRQFVDEFHAKKLPLHILVNNAGIYHTKYEETEDGLETDLSVNHLAPFLLTNLLLDDLKKSAPARIVNVASHMHTWTSKIYWDDLNMKKSYGSMWGYVQTKLYFLMFTFELARRLEGTGVTANALHPGTVGTRMIPWGFRWAVRTPYQGALTSLYLATSPDTEKVTGKYWANTAVAAPSATSLNEEDQKRLWEESAKLVALK